MSTIITNKELLQDLYNNLPRFNTLDSVCFCVQHLEIPVFWKNTGYEVKLDTANGQFNIVHENGSIVGLYHLDGKNSDYKAIDFFTYTKY